MTAAHSFAFCFFEGRDYFGGREVGELEVFGELLNCFSSLRGICSNLGITGQGSENFGQGMGSSKTFFVVQPSSEFRVSGCLDQCGRVPVSLHDCHLSRSSRIAARIAARL